jgi:hypothetical protein
VRAAFADEENPSVGEWEQHIRRNVPLGRGLDGPSVRRRIPDLDVFPVDQQHVAIRQESCARRRECALCVRCAICPLGCTEARNEGRRSIHATDSHHASVKEREQRRVQETDRHLADGHGSRRGPHLGRARVVNAEVVLRAADDEHRFLERECSRFGARDCKLLCLRPRPGRRVPDRSRSLRRRDPIRPRREPLGANES